MDHQHGYAHHKPSATRPIHYGGLWWCCDTFLDRHLDGTLDQIRPADAY